MVFKPFASDGVSSILVGIEDESNEVSKHTMIDLKLSDVVILDDQDGPSLTRITAVLKRPDLTAFHAQP